MGGKIYVCEHCKHGYFYPEKVGSTKKCDDNNSLKILEDWEEFECPTCRKKYDVLTLILLGENKTLPEGQVACRIDKKALVWQPFEDKEGVLQQDFKEDKDAWQEVSKLEFDKSKIQEEEFEAALMAAMKKPIQTTQTSRPMFTLETLGIKKFAPTEKETKEGKKVKIVKQKAPKIKVEKETKKPKEKKQPEKKETKEKAIPLVAAAMGAVLPTENKPKQNLAEVALNLISKENKAEKTEGSANPAVIATPPIKPQITPPKEVAVKQSEKPAKEQLPPTKLAELALNLISKESKPAPKSLPSSAQNPNSQSPKIVSQSANSTAEVQRTIPQLSTSKNTTDSKNQTRESIAAINQVKPPESVENEPIIKSVPSPMAGNTNVIVSTGAISSAVDSVSSSESVREIVSIPTEIVEQEEEIISPYADEFWQFYFIQKHIDDPEIYLGDDHASDKILGLLGEVNEIILNPETIDISRPWMEEQYSGQVYYVGDTHGAIIDTELIIQFFIEKITTAEKENKKLTIIFCGDYVDRHPMDIHNFCYIFAFAVKYRKYVRLLRGNHEEVTINTNYGFSKNIETQFGDKELFSMIEDTFANLPLIHVMENSKGTIVALHGGIPILETNPDEEPGIPDLIHGDIELDSRHASIEDLDTFSQQILWNDPAMDLPPEQLYLPSRRGIGINFGQKVFDRWMEVNDVDRIVRGHEVFMEGHQEFFGNRLFSIFSASDYAGRKIKAKILEMDFDKPWESNWRLIETMTDIPKILNLKELPKLKQIIEVDEE